jgi:aryl-alcohol dehydrogenase-like predicted oxidoreductase
MGMTCFYNQDPVSTEAESLRTFATALRLGVNHIDTAWIYRNHDTGHHNEELVAHALAASGRDSFVVATKFFPMAMEHGATEACVRAQLGESLARLGTTYVDLYYMHRVCSKVPPSPPRILPNNWDSFAPLNLSNALGASGGYSRHNEQAES